MKILVANVGSTSFKFRLYAMADADVLLVKVGPRSVPRLVAAYEEGTRVVSSAVADEPGCSVQAEAVPDDLVQVRD